MENYDLKCPHCQANIVKSSDMNVKMRVKLVRWDRDGMFAVCKSCTKDIRMDEDFFKSIRKRFVYEVKK